MSDEDKDFTVRETIQLGEKDVALVLREDGQMKAHIGHEDTDGNEEEVSEDAIVLLYLFRLLLDENEDVFVEVVRLLDEKEQQHSSTTTYH